MSINRIKELLAEILGVQPEDIAPERKLSSFGIDSYETVELMSALEKEYGIRLSIKDVKRFSTVADVASFIDNR